MIDMHELYWAAGFIEGEGSFIFSRRARWGNARISVPQVEIEPLHRLQRLMGGTICTEKGPNGRFRIFRLQIDGHVAVGWMMTLWTLMSAKRRSQIEAALNGWKALPLGARLRKRFANICSKGHALAGENLEWHKRPGGYMMRSCVKCRHEGAARRRREAHARSPGASSQLVLDTWLPRAQGTWRKTSRESHNQ